MMMMMMYDETVSESQNRGCQVSRAYRELKHNGDQSSV